MWHGLPEYQQLDYSINSAATQHGLLREHGLNYGMKKYITAQKTRITATIERGLRQQHGTDYCINNT